jgi:Zn-dependent peptidase ImmA (M78 family)
VQRSGHKVKVPVIVVNEDITLERRRLTLAHELAHRLIQESSPVDHEKAANIFAGAFLVDRDHLIREIGNSRRSIGYQELIELKRMYRVSAAAFLVRLRQVGIIDESTLAYAFQTYARGWRSSEPKPLEEPAELGKYERPKRFERLCYRALAERMISLAKATELLQQPPEKIEQGLKGPADADADHRQ